MDCAIGWLDADSIPYKIEITSSSLNELSSRSICCTLKNTCG